MDNNYIKSLFFLLLLFMSFATYSNTFYIDPLNGSADNDGSKESPWRMLQEVIEAGLIESKRWSVPYSPQSELLDVNPGAPVKPGDTLILMSGYHGIIKIREYVNSKDIVIRAGTDQQPEVSSIHMRASSHWVISGLRISPVYSTGTAALPRTLLNVESHGWKGPSSDIRLIGNEIFSAADVSGWSIEDWNNFAYSGVSVNAVNSIVANNTVYNINFGITTLADNAYVYGNSVINFSGDGLRGLGNYSEFANNLVANAFDVNGNHDDAFQSWTRNNKPVIGVTLRNNHFITDYNHPNPALLSNFQGIAAFAGFYEDWLIENNILQIEHWHGISLYGAINCTVVNNTVIDYNDDPRMRPWIKIVAHKNGVQGKGNVIRNNIARIVVDGEGTVFDHNLNPDYNEMSAYFTNRDNFDLTLSAGSPAIGAGSFHKAPINDAAGNARIRRIDIGAYQAEIR